MDEFIAFYETRPKREKWELIAGAPVMMAPPSRIHQRIADNLFVMLNARLEAGRPDWRADREVGVQLDEDGDYFPEPDVTVTDTELELGQLYAERFYFVAEVLSGSDRPESRDGSDKPIVLAAKLDYYRSHAPCRGVLVVRQDIIAADLHTRDGPDWRQMALTRPEDHIVIPDIGDIGPLAHLYRHTPLWQSQFAAL